MDVLLANTWNYARAYVDEIVVFNGTWDDHMTHLDNVMSILEETGLTLKGKKCQIGMTRSKHLGHVTAGEDLTWCRQDRSSPAICTTEN